MKFNVVAPTSTSFNEAVGITEDRANYLSARLDEISRSHSGRVVYVADIFKAIAAVCDTPEELVYCTINHCNYMAVRYGIFFCPPQNKGTKKPGAVPNN